MIEKTRPRPPGLMKPVLPIALVVLYLPLAVLVVSSFVDGGSFGFRWYEELFRDPVLWEALGRSVAVGFLSALASTLLAFVSAITLARWNFLGNIPLKVFSTLSLMLPELVLALSLLTWFATIGLQLGLTTVIIAHVTLTLPFAILVIGARLATLDRSIEDAARDLGASELQVLSRVTLPILSPALVSAFVLSFLLSFDDFLVTFFTNGAGSDTLPVKLYSMMKTGLTPKVQALASIMLLASVILVMIVVKLQSVQMQRPSLDD